ncbi:fragment of putative prophage integrase (part 1) [Bradyrhizobium sp. STM 3843]|uniref:tyrosine-type recombinase/integrase n=1 Tax=Bradyrhizobium sp. STM 3843 TaxID=551947 RepID=UPI00024038BB|nr:integrase arm-type DNA-binding domain-containing protein [Bradyrhizobium sp. STM 3843]CCE12120.1 fragment of putative prophage integrase (part 1) [Bradyrhizobium sp. STM 3843]
MQLLTQKPEITTKNYLSIGPGEYPCGNNLYLIVSPAGGRRWAFRYQRNGLVKKMGFGSAKETGLKLSEAKDKAIDALRLLAKGIDPREHRDEERRRTQGSRQFGEFAEEWRQTYETGMRHKAARAKLKRIVQIICKPLHRHGLDQIETAHVVDVLMTVWHQRETSRSTRQIIKKILDAAIAHNLRPKDNPADWASRLQPIMPKQRRRGTTRGGHKAMDYKDLPAFMHKLAAISTQSAQALVVTILTLARTAEVQNMRWAQLDLDNGLWDLGSVGTKSERPKRTPLPRQVLAYLREAYESRVSDEFVFPGRSLKRPISNMTMLKYLKELTGDESLTVHGFRTTFRTWAQEETHFEEEIVEHCLHHITGDDAEKAY